MGEFYRFILSLVIILVFLAVCYLLCINGTDQSLRGQAFGALAALAGGALGYWIGTTKSSADKDKTIAKMASTTEEQK